MTEDKSTFEIWRERFAELGEIIKQADSEHFYDVNEYGEPIIIEAEDDEDEGKPLLISFADAENVLERIKQIKMYGAEEAEVIKRGDPDEMREWFGD